jgi:hypothetical protein
MPFVPKHHPLLWLVAARRHLAAAAAAVAVQWERWFWVPPPAVCGCLRPAHENAMSLRRGAEIKEKPINNYPSGSYSNHVNRHDKAGCILLLPALITRDEVKNSNFI